MFSDISSAVAVRLPWCHCEGEKAIVAGAVATAAARYHLIVSFPFLALVGGGGGCVDGLVRWSTAVADAIAI